jgi:hypothetical protein
MQPDVTIVFEQEPTPEQSRALIDQLRELHAVSGAEPARIPAPEGAKGVEAILWREILVAIAPDAFTELVSWLRAWLRRPGAKALKLTAPLPDGSVLELDPGGEAPEALRAKIDAYRTAFGGG